MPCSMHGRTNAICATISCCAFPRSGVVDRIYYALWGRLLRCDGA